MVWIHVKREHDRKSDTTARLYDFKKKNGREIIRRSQTRFEVTFNHEYYVPG